MIQATLSTLPAHSTAIVIAAMLALSGCSQIKIIKSLALVGYKASWMIGDQPQSLGYSEKKIGPDRYLISVSDRPTAPSSWMMRVARARAGKIALENGHAYFKIEDVENKIRCVFTTRRPGTTLDFSGKRKSSLYTDRRLAMTIELTGSDPGPDLLNAQDIFSAEHQTLSRAKPSQAEMDAAYDRAVANCRQEEANRQTG